MNKYIYFFISVLFLIGLHVTTATASNITSYQNKERQSKIVVTGVVTDSVTKEPLIGATVKVKGGLSTITDVNGKYFLNVPYADASLVISYIGYPLAELK